MSFKSSYKKGKRKDIQRYKCQDCSHWFSSKKDLKNFKILSLKNTSIINRH